MEKGDAERRPKEQGNSTANGADPTGMGSLEIGGRLSAQKGITFASSARSAQESREVQSEGVGAARLAEGGSF